VQKVRRGKNRLNGFAWARSWVTALKRGVNEMIFTEQITITIGIMTLPICLAPLPALD
jgi:hypothetical protein